MDTEISFISGSILKMVLNSRGFFLSKQGYIGLARYDVRRQNLHTSRWTSSFILRQEGRYHVFKGECYIHGLVDGEGMRHPKVW